MSNTEKDSILDCLFTGQDMKLKNIRFFRGSDDVISESDFRDGIHSIGVQRKADSAKLIGWPVSDQPVVDVRAFVADI